MIEKIRRVHILAIACLLLAIISTALIIGGDTCAAVGLAGSIGIVAVALAEDSYSNGNGNHK